MDSPTSSAATPISKIALLSATGATGIGDHAVPLLFGQPTLGLQIEQLSKRGIDHFWVEVDTLPGAIVALADRFRGQGMVIEFVRSPQELSGKLEAGALLFVQADGIIADSELLTQILTYAKPIVATVDGRVENECFERIDLNTRWTGLALVDQRTIDGIAALPDGWNIGSSLLRQALQDGVEHRLIKQDVIQSGKLRRILGAADVDLHTKDLLKARTAGLKGFIEGRIFAPIATTVAPLIWPLKSGHLIVDGATLVTGSISLGASLAGFGAASAVIGLLSIFILCIRYSLQPTDNKSILYRSSSALAWAVLIASFGAILWTGGQGQLKDLFPGVMVSALLVLSRRADMPEGQRLSMPSPALVAVLMILFAAARIPVGGAMLIATAQLVLLLTGKGRAVAN